MPTAKTVPVNFGKTYEDKRTHRQGKLLEYNEKFKTYLFESSSGQTFNVSSSQFNINWIEIAEPRVVNREKANEAIKEKSKELNQKFVDLVLVASKFVDGFNNPDVTVKAIHDKYRLKFFIRTHVVFDMDIRLRNGFCRVWLNAVDNDAVSWTVSPLSAKYYTNSCRNYITEFRLDQFDTVLNDLSTLIVNKLNEEENKDEV